MAQDNSGSAVASLAALEARLAALEVVVGSDQGAPEADRPGAGLSGAGAGAGSGSGSTVAARSSGSTPVDERLSNAHSQLKQLEADHKAITVLRKKYVAVSRLLTVDPDAAALSTDAKAAVAIAMQPQLESTVSHLAEIQQLSDTAVNPESLAAVPGQSQRLSDVELTTARQAAAAAALRDSVNKMLASYDSVMQAVSAKFVQLDSTLADMESKVAAVQAAKQSS